jgi:hypothetical protein
LYQKPSADFIVAAFTGKPLPKAIKSASDPNWPGNAKGRPTAKGQASPKGQAPPKGQASPKGQAPPAKDQTPPTENQLLELYSVPSNELELPDISKISLNKDF